jgi:hypothetical protein
MLVRFASRTSQVLIDTVRPHLNLDTLQTLLENDDLQSLLKEDEPFQDLVCGVVHMNQAGLSASSRRHKQPGLLVLASDS